MNERKRMLGIEKTGFELVGNIDIPEIFFRRMKTNSQFDEIFGDGILPGSSFTVTAKAGTGKTTLLLQLMEKLAKTGKKVGYISCEESIYQLALSCKRLNVSQVAVANMCDIDEIAEAMKQFDLVIVDSLSKTSCQYVTSNTAVEKYAMETILASAKENDCSVGFVCHLTKGGKLKGNSSIEHDVDANIRITLADEDEWGPDVREIETYKNRFGKTGSIYSEMTSKGYDFSSLNATRTKMPKLNAKQKRIEEICEIASKPLTLREIVEELNHTEGNIKEALRTAVKDGKLIKDGRGSNATWKLAV